MRYSVKIGIIFALLVAAVVTMAQGHMPGRGGMYNWMDRDTVTLNGSPKVMSEALTLAKGGLIYDKWWGALDRDKPEVTHPAYPKSAKKSGADTWRCKECHGWDYKGKDGKYAQGSHATGIKGIRGAQGRDVLKITALLRAKPHGYTTAMIGDDALKLLAAFVARGQHDVDKYIDAKTGNVSIKDVNPAALLERGRSVFQTTCAACHGIDGRNVDFSDGEKPSFIGTKAIANPWEVLHKIRNGHPGAPMINLRAFPVEDAIAVLGYARKLPAK